MSLTLTVPKEYGYVLATATLSTLIATWHGINTGSYRKAAQIPYPNAYCTHTEAKESKEKYLFNCAQRAHANYIEHQPQFLVGLMVGGLRYPVLSAGLGVAWCVSRVAYTIGYCRADKEQGKGRSIGSVGSLVELVLLVMSGVVGVQTIMA